MAGVQQSAAAAKQHSRSPNGGSKIRTMNLKPSPLIDLQKFTIVDLCQASCSCSTYHITPAPLPVPALPRSPAHFSSPLRRQLPPYAAFFYSAAAASAAAASAARSSARHAAACCATCGAAAIAVVASCGRGAAHWTREMRRGLSLPGGRRPAGCGRARRAHGDSAQLTVWSGTVLGVIIRQAGPVGMPHGSQCGAGPAAVLSAWFLASGSPHLGSGCLRTAARHVAPASGGALIQLALEAKSAAVKEQ